MDKRKLGVRHAGDDRTDIHGIEKRVILRLIETAANGGRKRRKVHDDLTCWAPSSPTFAARKSGA
jgi:hypothetical protein